MAQYCYYCCAYLKYCDTFVAKIIPFILWLPPKQRGRVRDANVIKKSQKSVTNRPHVGSGLHPHNEKLFITWNDYETIQKTNLYNGFIVVLCNERSKVEECLSV